MILVIRPSSRIVCDVPANTVQFLVVSDHTLIVAPLPNARTRCSFQFVDTTCRKRLEGANDLGQPMTLGFHGVPPRGGSETRPYIAADQQHCPMNMIGHDHEGVCLHVGIVQWQVIPALAYDLASFFQAHLVLTHLTENAAVAVHADGDEVRPWLAVVVFFEADLIAPTGLSDQRASPDCSASFISNHLLAPNRSVGAGLRPAPRRELVGWQS